MGLLNLIILESFKKDWAPDGIMYHFTHIDNIESIISKGLLKNKNNAYVEGCEGVFLTVKEYPDDANLPSHLMDEYQESFDDDGQIQYPVIARISINIEDLFDDKFDVDDDYKMISQIDYGFKNKREERPNKLEDSLFITGSLCYTDVINRKYIERIEVYTDWETYEDY